MLELLQQNAGLLEQYALAAIVVGALLALVGYLWLVRRGFAESWGWGFAALIPPFQLLFWYQKPRQATPPWLVILLGGLVVGGTIGLVRYVNLIDLGERERFVEGKLHLTLTGWDRDDYSILKKKSDVAVLQMANADVDDEVVGYLAGFEKLEVLELTDSKITDASLAVLGKLPKLRVLKVARTKISDEAFRKHLLGCKQLMELDVRETKLASRTLREWKNANTDRRYTK